MWKLQIWLKKFLIALILLITQVEYSRMFQKCYQLFLVKIQTENSVIDIVTL